MEKKIKMIANKVPLEEYDQSFEDMQYWLSKTPQEQIAAVTFLVQQNLAPRKSLDKRMLPN